MKFRNVCRQSFCFFVCSTPPGRQRRQNKGGNVVEYRLRLLGKIGADRLSFLEGHHEPVKLTIDDAKTIKRIYQLKLKDLRAARAEKEAA